MTEALKLLKKPIKSTVWRDFRWADLRTRVEKHLKNPNSMDQGKLHLCMSAVALSLTAKNNPHRYVQLVREVYEQGTFNGRSISKKLLTGSAKSTDTLDWMMLSASRNAYGRSGYAGGTGFKRRATNLPAEMNRFLTEITGYKKTKSYSRILRNGADLIPRLNAQMTGGSKEVVLLMSMKGLRQEHGHNLHWTRLVGPIVRLPPATRVTRPTLDPFLGVHVVRWQEADGRSASKTFTGARKAQAFARMLGQRRVKLVLFDHGRELPVHLTERAFGSQLLFASLPSL